MEQQLRMLWMRRQFVRYRLLLFVRWLSEMFYEVPEAVGVFFFRLLHKFAR